MSLNINNDIERILITEEEIITRCMELSKEISKDYENKKPLLICTLKGAVSFFSKLAEQITIPLEYDFVKAKSYEGTTSTGNVKFQYMPGTPLEGRNLIIIEDIIDTGRTLDAIVKEFEAFKPTSIELACLLDKPSMRVVETLTPKYVGFKIPNEFVVGFGLDYDEEYRNLPYVGVLKPSVYTK